VTKIKFIINNQAIISNERQVGQEAYATQIEKEKKDEEVRLKTSF